MKTLNLNDLASVEGGGVVYNRYCGTALALVQLGYITHNYLLIEVACGLARAYCEKTPCICGGGDSLAPA